MIRWLHSRLARNNCRQPRACYAMKEQGFSWLSLLIDETTKTPVIFRWFVAFTLISLRT